MFSFDEDEEYEKFGSRRNQLLLRVVVDLATRHDLHWQLNTEEGRGFSMELLRPSARTRRKLPAGRLGEVLEAALKVIEDWTGEDYGYNRRCTFYGLDAHKNEIQYLNGPDGKRGYWAAPGQVWAENRINEIDVPADAVFESVVSGQMYNLPYAGQRREECLMVQGTAYAHPLENNPKFFYHPPPEWLV